MVMDATELDFCSCITNNLYFKVFFVIVFGLVLTFVHEIDFLHNKIALAVILFVMLMMLFTHADEFGVILFLIALFVLTYNISINYKKKKDDAHPLYKL